MRTIKVLLFAILAISMNISCSAQTNKGDKSSDVSEAGNVEVYYFHYTRRCATCNAVESVSKELVAEQNSGKVTFADFNLDEEAGEAKGKSLAVSGQTLLIVAGDTKIDITDEAFMNARSNPDKLKAIMKEKIDELIN